MTLLIKNIKKQYKEKLIFENVSLTVKPSQIIALKGKSGTGKSTLLNILAGLEKPTSGDIILNESSFAQKSLNELSSIRAENIGYVSQFNPMIPKLTALQNITVPLWLNKKKKNEINTQNRIKHFAQLLQVEQLLDKKIEKLSGGELQRIGIIRALINEPKLIIADEPTASLDDEAASLVLECFNEIKGNGTIILLATHNINIASLCDCTYLLTKNGLVTS
ncbi:peptide ABC transporter ATPase [Paenibacillus stellifer]|uniref:Peptide ABC transporter ATPase n=1 Tax=Paenibacillus stellifer TaxID=169760 RepID=A0A089LY25_9BACL|nr:ATP-binding cassette domain-containing protein [Paenibacillus stellifer]AIQ65045.1 peptide ABC transporter ATPase [Paenibacillus stellifer]